MAVLATLEREHALIEQALNLLAAVAGRFEQGQALPGAHIQTLLAFLRDFADGRHHAREEEVLFPWLEQRGIAKVGGPLGILLHEHEQGRTMIRIMEGLLPELAGSSERRQRFAQVAMSYAELMRKHVARENALLSAMGNLPHTPADHQALEAAFSYGNSGDATYTFHQEAIAELSAQLAH